MENRIKRFRKSWGLSQDILYILCKKVGVFRISINNDAKSKNS